MWYQDLLFQIHPPEEQSHVTAISGTGICSGAALLTLPGNGPHKILLIEICYWLPAKEVHYFTTYIF